jgi:small subunit ribosomal protein S18
MTGRPGGRPGGRAGGGRRGGKKFQRRTPATQRIRTTTQRKPSYLEEHRIEYLDYKDVKLLQKFMNPQGKILPRRLTRLTVTQHRELTKAVKNARFLGMMPFVSDSEAY